MDDAKKLLDSLMGSARNLDRKEAKARKGQNFKESDICKFYLLGFCPQHEELFHSTKRDIGSCSKVHSDAMKEEYEASPDKAKWEREYGRQLRTYLEELVRGADDWVEREKRNIKALNDQIQAEGPSHIAQAEIKKLTEQATDLIAEAETAAEEGNIPESKRMLELAEECKAKADSYEDKAKAARTEDVCNLCGSRLESGDPNKAKFRHEDGKIHFGYVKIRKWLADIRQRLDEPGNPEDDKRGADRERQRDRDDRGAAAEEKRGADRERRRDRSRSRDPAATGARSSGRDGDRDRERDQDRDRSDRHRGRESDRGGGYDRGVARHGRGQEQDPGDRGGDRSRHRDRGRGAEYDRGRGREHYD